jgi:hypothetical protein
VSFIDDQKCTDAYKVIWDNYLDSPKKFQAWKDISVYIMYNAWMIPTPVSYMYTFWQPWIGGYHGEYAVGNSIFNFPKWIWEDVDIKYKMTGIK